MESTHSRSHSLMRSETERSEQPKEGLGRLDDVTEYLLSLTQKHFNILFHPVTALRRTRYYCLCLSTERQGTPKWPQNLPRTHSYYEKEQFLS